jgi:hypothetical protein
MAVGHYSIYFNIPFKNAANIRQVCTAVLDFFGGFFDNFVAYLLALKKSHLSYEVSDIFTKISPFYENIRM